MSKINVAIIGAGNCASSLVQGVYKYWEADEDVFIPDEDTEGVLAKISAPTMEMLEEQLGKLEGYKRGIDWTKDNVYEAIGRPELDPDIKN